MKIDRSLFRFLPELIITIILILVVNPLTDIGAQDKLKYNGPSDDLLANNKIFLFWNLKGKEAKTYVVDMNHQQASDKNEGATNSPFRTISHAAEIAQPGDRIIIHGGIYRESIHPARGGLGPDKMISYEGAKGEEVIVSGSVILDSSRWKYSEGWIFSHHEAYTEEKIVQPVRVWQYDFDGSEFMGYNPFGMLNLMHDRSWLQYQKVTMDPHFKRRGLIFLNGQMLEQVLNPTELAGMEKGAYWVEHNGMRIHVRFPGNTKPSSWLIEATAKEQLFVPREYGLGYIQVKNITFKHAGNGFPVPQRGMISANRGNHWVIEGCIIEWANSLGIDLGNEMWNTSSQPLLGYHIIHGNIIRHCGIGGLESLGANQLLVEDNLFEDIGWQNAEQAWESGAIKFHNAVDCLIRRNVFRDIKYAPGIWLDYLSNKNCRITRNVFTKITTARGAVYVEVSHNHCLIDQNIFHDLHCQYWISGEYGAGGSALYTDGSDSIDFSNNIILEAENSGYTDYLNAERIVGTRGGIARWHRVTNNIFIECHKQAIEFANIYNFSDGNIFGKMSPGYLKIGNPAPALLLDLEAWQRAFDWEKNGKQAKITGIFDPVNLELKVSFDDEGLPLLKGKGPFRNYTSSLYCDPRILEINDKIH